MNTPNHTTIVVLYTELAGYTLTCLQTLINTHNVTVHVFRLGVNNQAPFEFNLANTPQLYLYNQGDYTAAELLQTVSTLSPQLIYCAGWSNKKYLHVVRKLSHINSVLCFDNKWTGTIKQRLGSVYAQMRITPYFNYAFVAGMQQQLLALKMGFTTAQIQLGVYAADVTYFNNLYQQHLEYKRTKTIKRFVYSGRYVSYKGIEQLWQAFAQLCAEHPTINWELWCIGTGTIQPYVHERIKHFGFVQPHQLQTILKDTDVFVLPSLVEPWGVVVHEFAAAGFPLLLSTEIGAKELFLTKNNGIEVEPNNVLALKTMLYNFTQLSNEQLQLMSAQSNVLANNYTPTHWATKVMYMLQPLNN